MAGVLDSGKHSPETHLQSIAGRGEIEIRRGAEHGAVPVACRDGQMIKSADGFEEAGHTRFVSEVDNAANRSVKARDSRFDLLGIAGRYNDLRAQLARERRYCESDARGAADHDHSLTVERHSPIRHHPSPLEFKLSLEQISRRELFS